MLFYVFLSEGKHLLMFNVQLYLTFERVSVTLKFPLCRRVDLMVMDTTPLSRTFQYFSSIFLLELFGCIQSFKCTK